MTTQPYTFEIVGVAERSEFGGAMMVGSEVFIGSGPAATMRKIVLTSIWDFFQDSSKKQGYSSLNIKLKSIRELEPVRIELKKRNLRSFALIDRLEEIQKGFLFMDMFLLAVGMIAIVVATLGIVNTMVMSILERYKEIGIMKAVGASEGDVKRIFFFESGTIGFMGGVFGLGLGWLVGEAINQVVNIYLSRQGVGFVDYFRFPWWLCLGAVVFAVSISLMAGIYPARRAARVDPIVALRHD